MKVFFALEKNPTKPEEQTVVYKHHSFLVAPSGKSQKDSGDVNKYQARISKNVS